MMLPSPWPPGDRVSCVDLTRPWPLAVAGNSYTPTPHRSAGGWPARAGAPPPFSVTKKDMMSNSHHDPVNHPSHYTEHASGVECIQITEHMNFCLGNAVKYIWRAGLKNDNAIEDLKKARWYVDRELERLTK